MKPWGSRQDDSENGPPSDGFVNVRSIRRAKIAMFFIIAPLGIIVVSFFSTLKLGEKFNIDMLWLSVIAVVAYALETYELRKTSEAQVDLQRSLMMNEFLPIIVPSGEGFIRGGNLELNVINCGKGVAKDVRVKLNGHTISKAMAILSDGLPVTLQADQNIELIREITKDGEAKEISLDIVYRDIYEREMKTVGLKFKVQRTGRNTRYILRRIGWQYQNNSKIGK